MMMIGSSLPSVVILSIIIHAVVVATAAAAAPATPLPAGYLVSMMATDPSHPTQYYPYSIDITTGDDTQLSSQPFDANFSATINGGSYDHTTKQLQFMVRGSSLVTFDLASHQYTSTNVYYGFGASILGVRTDRTTGITYGASAMLPGWDMQPSAICRLHRADNGSLSCSMELESAPFTAAYILGNVAVGGGHLSMITEDRQRGGARLYDRNIGNTSTSYVSVQPSATITYRHLCYDDTTKALYSLQQDTPISPIPKRYGSRIVKMDAVTGVTTVIAKLAEETIVGECYGGYFFAVSAETQLGDYLLYNIDLTTGNVNWNAVSLSGSPSVLAFVPQ